MTNDNIIIMTTGDGPISVPKVSPEKRNGYYGNLSYNTKCMIANITVEPVLGLFMVAMVLSSFATQNLNLQKACRVNLMLNDTVCSVMESPVHRDDIDGVTAVAVHAAETLSQELVADMLIWKTVLQSVIPGVLVVFIGSWSDRNRKRKPCMIVPVVGEFLATVGRLMCVYFYTELPMEVTAIAETVPAALTGGTLALTLSVFSYIGDVTTVKTRTFRIGLANAVTALGGPVATILFGVLIPVIGIPGVFAVSLVLLVICFAYGVIVVQESATIQRSRDQKPTNIEPSSVVERIRDFFNLQHIKDAFRVTFKTRSHNRRLRIALLMCTMFMVLGPTQGEIFIMYMFTRVRFGWKEVEFSWFITYFVIVNVIGTTFSVSLFSRYLRMDDALVGAMACISQILSGYVYAFGTTEWAFYLGPVVEVMSGTAAVALRSIITKLVVSEELGQVTSVFGVCETLVPVIYGPLYSAVYKTTLKSTMPGLCFLIGTLSLTPAVLIFLWIYMEHKKQENMELATQISNEKNTNHIYVNKDQLGSYSKLPTNENHK